MSSLFPSFCISGVFSLAAIFAVVVLSFLLFRTPSFSVVFNSIDEKYAIPTKPRHKTVTDDIAPIKLFCVSPNIKTPQMKLNNTITHDQIPTDIAKPVRLMAYMPAVPPGTHNIAETKLHGVKSEDNDHL